VTPGQLAARAAALAETLAGPAAVAGGIAPVERTADAPWEWATAQALRSRVDPSALAACLATEPGVATAQARPDGLVAVRLSAAALVAALAATPSGMPRAPVRAPAPGADGVRFEAARRAAGAPALAAGVSARRTLDNPVFAVQLAHARAAARSAAPPSAAAESAATESAATELENLDPAAARLATELLDAPRRLAEPQTRPAEAAAALGAVAAAYHLWEASRSGGDPRTHGPVDGLLDRVTAGVLERGTALLGVSAPARI